ncbi:class II fumarate hydratase [Alcanivorax sp. JB21]|uniref:class II fumarate hydratase n=1 Tax=Alcanivorax limicola TaxID=2874102 RepID=UPI001CC19601|nr:class II fumarate hydratase [Alcanivorax limicola]MBZ2188964.1 class II fumarate hydratase [Alcanivorax limicola]
MAGTRTEKDSMGEMTLPAHALWGAQTQRAVENFPVFGPLPASFIHAVTQIKWCAAEANRELGLLDEPRAAAIRAAADQVLNGDHDDQFPVDIFQTGSGTSTNMNVNEVLSHLCEREGTPVHPNDHVNLGQSSNDTIPTAIHLSATMALTGELLPAISELDDTLARRAEELDQVVKTGRTHLMDAMPVTFGQELGGWRAQLAFAGETLRQARDGLLLIPQGGTAVGNGVNTHPDFATVFARHLSERSGHAFTPLASAFAGQSAIDRPLALSGALRGYAVVLMKLANDLRWMNAGPIDGLSEIRLPAVQPGSSIMPGKVNPVICESACMVSAQVMGLDQANTIAAQSGNFQLNVMLPLVAANLLNMTGMLANVTGIMASKAVAGFTVNTDRLADAVGRNPILVTALNPVIGYEKAAEIAKQAYQSGRPVIDVAEEMTDLSREALTRYLDPSRLTRGGLQDS